MGFVRAIKFLVKIQRNMREHTVLSYRQQPNSAQNFRADIEAAPTGSGSVILSVKRRILLTNVKILHFVQNDKLCGYGVLDSPKARQ